MGFFMDWCSEHPLGAPSAVEAAQGKSNRVKFLSSEACFWPKMQQICLF